MLDWLERTADPESTPHLKGHLKLPNGFFYHANFIFAAWRSIGSTVRDSAQAWMIVRRS